MLREMEKPITIVEMLGRQVKTTGIVADYRDTEHTRMKDGIMLPQLTKDLLGRFGQEKWTEWSQLRLDVSRCFYVQPSGNVVLRSTIERVLGKTASPHQLLATYMTVPNGQVKNFMNAVRSFNALKVSGGRLNIVVVGSKAQEGGGMWHKYFALYVSRYAEANIFFYDYAEIADSFEINGHFKVSMTWKVSGLQPSDITDKIDLLVDDVWTQSSGPSQKYTFLPKHYTLKGDSSLQEGYEPFLHESETRRFSSPPRVMIPECRCLLCDQIGRCSEDYAEYRFLRSLCSRLGHHSYCSGSAYVDQQMVSRLLRDLYKLPQIELKGKAVVRGMLSLTEEIGFEVEGVIMRRVDKKPSFLTYTRFSEKYTVETKRYPFLEGRTVSFAGVPASILGSTKIVRPGTSTVGPVSVNSRDVIFVNSFETWSFHSTHSQVYAPYPIQEVRLKMPGWEQGSTQVDQYILYYRVTVPSISPLIVKPYQRLRGIDYDVSDLYPYIQSQVLPRPLSKKGWWYEGGQKFTLSIDKGVMTLHPYNGNWRSSIFVYSSGQYSFMSVDPRGERDDTFLGLPLDIEDITKIPHEAMFPAVH